MTSSWYFIFPLHAMAKDEHRIFLAGDAMITQPWKYVNKPPFIKLIEEMRNANTTIVNLETLIHEYKGYAQAHFVYQTDQIMRLPTEAYQRVGLDNTVTSEEFHGDGKRFNMQRTRSVYEVFAAILDYSNGRLNQIRLIPVDLQFDANSGVRGRPQYANDKLGRRIIAQVAKLSSVSNTKIKYDQETNQGFVENI